MRKWKPYTGNWIQCTSAKVDAFVNTRLSSKGHMWLCGEHHGYENTIEDAKEVVETILWLKHGEKL